MATRSVLHCRFPPYSFQHARPWKTNSALWLPDLYKTCLSNRNWSITSLIHISSRSFTSKAALIGIFPSHEAHTPRYATWRLTVRFISPRAPHRSLRPAPMILVAAELHSQYLGVIAQDGLRWGQDHFHHGSETLKMPPFPVEARFPNSIKMHARSYISFMTTFLLIFELP